MGTSTACVDRPPAYSPYAPSTAARLVLPLPLGIEIKPCLGRGPRAREQPAEDVPLPWPFGRPSRGSPSNTRGRTLPPDAVRSAEGALRRAVGGNRPIRPGLHSMLPGCDSA